MSTPSKADEILHKFAGCGYPHPDYMSCEWCDNLPETKQQVYKAIMEIIGKDELNVQNGDAVKYSKEQLERLIPIRQRLNYLKAQQRERARAFFGVSDG